MSTLDPLPPSFASTRESLRAVACYVLGPWRRARTGRIGLRPFAGGFATPPLDDGTRLGVIGDELVSGEKDRHRLTTLAAAASWAGVELSADPGVGADLPPLVPDADLAVDFASSAALGRWYAFGADVLAAVVTDGSDASEAQLWPEHFDLAVVVTLASGAFVNVGCSAGDGFHAEPYVYVGPHDRDGLAGDYWNAPFGAVLGHRDLRRVGDPVATAGAFVAEGLGLVAAR